MTYGEMTLGTEGDKWEQRGDNSELRATKGDKWEQRGDKSELRATEGDRRRKRGTNNLNYG